MFHSYKIVRGAFVAGFAVVVAAGSASAQEMKFGNRATLNLDGKVNSQVATALGRNSTAHNVVGGITSGGALSVGDRASITTRAQSNSQLALASGRESSATNNIGGVLTTGPR